MSTFNLDISVDLKTKLYYCI